MSIAPDLTNSMASVTIRPGPPQPGPISIASVALNAEGNLTVTLSDGTALPSVPFAQFLAQALQGTQLVAADADGSVLVRGVATIGRDSNGRLMIASPLPAGATGLNAGSGVLYRNPDGTLGVA